MSEPPKDTDESRITKKTTTVEPTPVLGTPGYTATHVDRIMAYVDPITDTATLTLFSMHVVPDVDAKNLWNAKQFVWEPVGEIKVPVPVLNAFSIYYIHAITNGLDIMPQLTKWVKEHPQPDPRPSTYGPTRFTTSTEKPD